MNYNITPKRFLEIVEKTKPTGNVYADTYAVTHFGEYIYNVVNYQKWKSCNTLQNDVFKCITELYPLTMTQLSKITQIFNDANAEVSDPIYTKTTIDTYIIDEYTKEHNINNRATINIENIDKAKTYLEFSQKLYKALTAVYNIYEPAWKTIEDSYDIVCDKMEEVYGDLEDVYSKFDVKIDVISNLVDSKIIGRYGQILNVEQLEREITDCFNHVMSEKETDEETKNLINTITVPHHISFHKLNYTMSCGILKLLN